LCDRDYILLLILLFTAPVVRVTSYAIVACRIEIGDYDTVPYGTVRRRLCGGATQNEVHANKDIENAAGV